MGAGPSAKDEMSKTYLFAPQWQDSGSTNELYSGAVSLRNYLKSICNAAIDEIEIPEHQIPVLHNNILGYAIIEKQLSDISSTLADRHSAKIIAIGGGCGIEVPIVSHLVQRYSDLQVIWFDAHGDLNSPESSPSKHFHGMPLRFIVERQLCGIGSRNNLLSPSRVCLVGTRDLDPPEEDFIKANRIKVVAFSAGYRDRLEAAVLKNTSTYIHIDLDVLDPSEYRNVKCPVKEGLSIADLERSIDSIISRNEVVGMSMVENIETDISRVRKLHGILERAIAL
jgi:arginase